MDFKEINIDFNILETSDPKYLRIHDISYWSIIKNKPSVIDVKVPGSGKFVRNVFPKSEIFSLNSATLNINCFSGDCGDIEFLDLPDGLYEISLKGSPSTFEKTKHYLRTSKFDLKYDELLLNMYKDGKKCCKDDCKKEEINFLKSVADAAVRKGDYCKAQDAFYQAQELLDDALNCKDC